MLKKIMMAAAATVAMTGAASALTITNAAGDCETGSFGTITCGSTNNPNGHDRTDIGNVELGAGDGNFYSLGRNSAGGLGGSATFDISPNFTGPLTAIEITFGSSYPLEQAIVEVGRGSVFQNIGVVSNQPNAEGNLGNMATLMFEGSFDQIRFTDVSVGPANGDGFDLDAFTVAAVPVPAAGLLLLGGLGALGAASRRRRKAA